MKKYILLGLFLILIPLASALIQPFDQCIKWVDKYNGTIRTDLVCSFEDDLGNMTTPNLTGNLYCSTITGYVDGNYTYTWKCTDGSHNQTRIGFFIVGYSDVGEVGLWGLGLIFIFAGIAFFFAYNTFNLDKTHIGIKVLLFILTFVFLIIEFHMLSLILEASVGISSDSYLELSNALTTTYKLLTWLFYIIIFYVIFYFIYEFLNSVGIKKGKKIKR